MSVQEMIQGHPGGARLDEGAVAACVEECLTCAATCTSCADACLAEEMVAELRRCIRLNLDCADACTATERVAARQTELDVAVLAPLLDACAQICQLCADECERHARAHEHCRICADACRRCARACTTLLATL